MPFLLRSCLLTVRFFFRSVTHSLIASHYAVFSLCHDAGAGFTARFSLSMALLRRSDNSIIITEVNNNVVRVISPTGTITQVAGYYLVSTATADGTLILVLSCLVFSGQCLIILYAFLCAGVGTAAR